MNHDQNKKTLRQFQCRDYLWEIFEQMSGELECSVDYLINEAMRQYARSRNYGVRTPGPGASRPGGPTPGAIPSMAGGGQPHIPSAPPPPQQGVVTEVTRASPRASPRTPRASGTPRAPQ